jgi:ABC-type glycerol-3-phosphate transport system substrate-binding protein
MERTGKRNPRHGKEGTLMKGSTNKTSRRKAETGKVTRREFMKTTAGIAAGIAAGTYPFSGAIAPAFAKRKIKLLYWARDYNEKDAKQYAAEFMKLHPEYEIAVEGIPWTGMYEKINTSLVAGKSADLLSLGLPWIAAFAESGFLHPLDSVWERDVSASDRKDYFPGGISYATYRDKLYGTPWRVDGNMLIWSVDAFKEAGLDPTKGPDTWEEVLEYGNKLTVADPSGKITQYGFSMFGKPPGGFFDWFLTPLMWSFGGYFTDEEVTRSRIDEKPVIEAFKYAAELNTKYKIATPAAFSYQWSDLSPLLAKRTTAVLFGHQANFKVVWQVSPGMKLAAAPYPKGPAGRYTMANGWCHSIPVTANLEEVWPFVLYLQDPMRQATLTVGAPGRQAGLAHPKYDVFKKDPLLQYAAGSGADTATVRPINKSPLGHRILDEMGRIFSEAWEGKITPKDAALKAHDRVSGIIRSA